MSTSATIHDYGDPNSLNYADYGFWDTTTGSGATPAVGFYAGGAIGEAPTPAASMPTTGSATYSGAALGGVVTNSQLNYWSGTSTLTATFASNAISGAISNIQAYSAQNTALGTINNINLSGTISGATYSGTAMAAAGTGTFITVPTSATSFSFKGAFYGPTAQETAGAFLLSSGTSGSGVTMFGVFGAKQPSDRRLKADIEAAGRLPNGLQLYSWRYLNGTHRFTGVMAQELLGDARFADAVSVGSDGLMRVDYARIGYLPANLAAMACEGEAAVALYRREHATRH